MINIDYSKDSLFDTFGLATLQERYMLQNETSPQDRFAFVCSAFASDPDHANRMYHYASHHWISFSTPILAYGKGGLPISCYLPYLDDTKESLINTSTECRMLSMMGGGIGLGVGIRGKTDKSTGVIPHMKTYDADTLAYKQGSTRRGSISVNLNISHPEIMEFLEMRKPTGGDPDLKCRNLHHAVNIPDEFMFKLKHKDDSWNLIDPHTGEVTQTVSARRLWERILETRHQTGEPFLHFIDNSNAKVPDFQMKKGLTVKQTNLCTEIIEVTDADRTAVCCLLSFNVARFDEWKDNQQIVADCVEFLDNVLSVFIKTAPKELHRAVYSASQERAIGLGVLGFHEYLLNNNIPFESAIAVNFNLKMIRKISTEAKLATIDLAIKRGPCPDSKDADVPVRNARLLAVAPNASTSIIMGNTSPSIEPYSAMVYAQKTLSGVNINKVKAFTELLKTKYPEQNVDKVYESVIEHKGSVQHLDFLSEWDKDVFKTARELDQHWIITHAAMRNDYVDQGQSLNTFWTSDTDIVYFHDVHYMAWEKGLPTLYYARSENVSMAANIATQVARKKIDTEECLACQ